MLIVMMIMTMIVIVMIVTGRVVVGKGKRVRRKTNIGKRRVRRDIGIIVVVVQMMMIMIRIMLLLHMMITNQKVIVTMSHKLCKSSFEMKLVV